MKVVAVISMAARNIATIMKKWRDNLLLKRRAGRRPSGIISEKPFCYLYSGRWCGDWKKCRLEVTVLVQSVSESDDRDRSCCLDIPVSIMTDGRR